MPEYGWGELHTIIEKRRSDTDSERSPRLGIVFIYGDAVRDCDSEFLCQNRTLYGTEEKRGRGCVGPATGKQNDHRNASDVPKADRRLVLCGLGFYGRLCKG